MKTEDIRKGLRDFRTRAATMDQVASGGAEQCSLVRPLLQDRHDGVRWAAIRIIGEIGDEEAIADLITLLEQGKNKTDVENALRSLTGQTLDGVQAWRVWAGMDPEEREKGRPLLSDEALLQAAVEGMKATVEKAEAGFHVTVSLPNRRTQHVWVDFSQTDHNDRQLVQLSTPCGPADPERYESVLKLNMSISYGAIALADLEDQLCFAMVDAYLRASVHPEDLGAAILSLAEHGDSLEKSITGRADEY